MNKKKFAIIAGATVAAILLIGTGLVIALNLKNSSPEKLLYAALAEKVPNRYTATKKARIAQTTGQSSLASLIKTAH